MKSLTFECLDREKIKWMSEGKDDKNHSFNSYALTLD